MSRNTIYIVREEIEGGYMPDSVSYFTTKRSAQECARDRAQDARNDGYTVTGNMKDGYTLTHEDASDYTLNNLIIIDSISLEDARRNMRGLLDSDGLIVNPEEMSLEEIVSSLNDYTL